LNPHAVRRQILSLVRLPISPLPRSSWRVYWVRYARDSGGKAPHRGILIPATAQMGKRLAWARVVALGPNVRTVELADRVLFDPEELREVEVRGEMFVLMRERDIHAVASSRLGDSEGTGLYL
jgi:chaperonin GroES